MTSNDHTETHPVFCAGGQLESHVCFGIVRVLVLGPQVSVMTEQSFPTQQAEVSYSYAEKPRLECARSLFAVAVLSRKEGVLIRSYVMPRVSHRRSRNSKLEILQGRGCRANCYTAKTKPTKASPGTGCHRKAICRLTCHCAKARIAYGPLYLYTMSHRHLSWSIHLKCEVRHACQIGPSALPSASVALRGPAACRPFRSKQLKATHPQSPSRQSHTRFEFFLSPRARMTPQPCFLISQGDIDLSCH